MTVVTKLQSTRIDGVTHRDGSQEIERSEQTAPAGSGPAPLIQQGDGSYCMELAMAGDRPAVKFDAIGGLVTVDMELISRKPGSGREWEAKVVMREEAAFRLWAHLDALFRENVQKLS